MALLHAATLSPSKAELIDSWLPSRPWAPDGEGELELVGAFRFDDPDGKVGLEVHLARRGGVLVQVPLTYREAPLDGADQHLVGTMQHSALGERWVYDGVGDPVFTRMLAAAALTGFGQAVGMAEHDGRWYLVPPPVRLQGGGWTDQRVPVDGLEPVAVASDADDGWAVLRSDLFELRLARRPVAGPRPPIGLTATWAGQDEPVVLAEVLAL